jgi:hypothetical protein
MDNFSIQFTSPWLLLLLIPAVIFTLIPYFRASKRYRKTRNRITSIVLHLCVMTLAIALLAGMTFHYTIPNEKNEIILLVDVSDTEETAADARDSFVETVLQDSSYDGYNVGIVTFGFDQVYAVPLTKDVEGIYDLYLDSGICIVKLFELGNKKMPCKSIACTNPNTAFVKRFHSFEKGFCFFYFRECVFCIGV